MWLSQDQIDNKLIETRWRETFPLRQLELGKNKTKFLDDWPIFKKPNGFEYIDMDFFEAHPENCRGLIDNYKVIFETILEKSFEKSQSKFSNFDPLNERTPSK